VSDFERVIYQLLGSSDARAFDDNGIISFDMFAKREITLTGAL
jgi:hypothetical protein